MMSSHRKKIAPGSKTKQTRKDVARAGGLPAKGRTESYYPPLSDNRYKGLLFWWTFGELRADPDQLTRYIKHL